MPAGDVVINEVAWMGTSNSSYDEWLELRNNTSEDINLLGWTLQAADGTPSIKLAGTIVGRGFFLLERTDDSSVAGVTADQIYTGALGDSGETLELKNPAGLVVDSVSGWHAGDAKVDATMERVDYHAAGSADNWVDGVTIYEGGFGTPRAANGAPGADRGRALSECVYPAALEITSINIGQGDATLVATPTKLLLADAGETYWSSHADADKIAQVIRDKYGANCSHLDYVLISHIHLDHIGYIQLAEGADGNLLDENGNSYEEGENPKDPRFLAGYAYLAKGHSFTVGTTLIRDFVTHNPNPSVAKGGSKTYRNWRAYLLSAQGRADFNPITAQLGAQQINLGSVNGKAVTTDIILVDGATPSNPNGCDPATYFLGADDLLRGDRTGDSSPPSENDLSVAFIVSLGRFQMFIGGDTSGENHRAGAYQYHDVETCLVEDEIVRQQYGGHLEVLRVSHHGSSHSTNQTFVDAFSPRVSIFSAGDNNPYGHVHSTVLDRILTKTVESNAGVVFMMEAGAGMSVPADACLSTNATICAEIADGEFPTVTESNEKGDAGVSITVSADGSSYTVQGDPAQSVRTFLSK